jgi:hypothetical protein
MSESTQLVALIDSWMRMLTETRPSGTGREPDWWNVLGQTDEDRRAAVHDFIIHENGPWVGQIHRHIHQRWGRQ